MQDNLIEWPFRTDGCDNYSLIFPEYDKRFNVMSYKVREYFNQLDKQK